MHVWPCNLHAAESIEIPTTRETQIVERMIIFSKKGNLQDLAPVFVVLMIDPTDAVTEKAGLRNLPNLDHRKNAGLMKGQVVKELLGMLDGSKADLELIPGAGGNSRKDA